MIAGDVGHNCIFCDTPDHGTVQDEQRQTTASSIATEEGIRVCLHNLYSKDGDAACSFKAPPAVASFYVYHLCTLVVLFLVHVYIRSYIS